jgi:steroid 5-alpha reductase family enzyme
MMAELHILLLGWMVLAVIMALLWLVQFKTKNAGIVDVAWAFGTGILGVWFALAGHEGDATRGLVVALLVGIWGARLGFHLASRVMRESEDGRYRHLRTALGRWTQPVMFLFFQIQALWGLMFAMPMWAAVQSPHPTLAWNDWLGIAIWIVAFSGELIADRQLDGFRSDPRNRGKVCQVGLWRYSRHPNYFFEWLHWWAYVLIGLGSPWWWITIAGVIVMYVFLTRITGIPYTEEQAIRSRGDAYRRYQETTNVFFPFTRPKISEEQAS